MYQNRIKMLQISNVFGMLRAILTKKHSYISISFLIKYVKGKGIFFGQKIAVNTAQMQF